MNHPYQLLSKNVVSTEEAGIIHSQKIKLFRAISPINYSENKTHKRQENEH